jgi:hypothetical protein
MTYFPRFRTYLFAACPDGDICYRPLPMEDHNTRIIVFGSNAREARAVADAIASEAFHNVSFLVEPIEEVQRALQ